MDPSGMSRVRELHTTVLANVGRVQQQTASLLKQQEEDLMAAFKGKLVELHDEVGREKSKGEKLEAPLLTRIRELERQLEFSRATNERTEASLKAVQKENGRLKDMMSSLTGDREGLVKQLVVAKKETVRAAAEAATLRAECKAAVSELEDLRESAAIRLRRAHDGPPNVSVSALIGSPPSSPPATPVTPATRAGVGGSGLVGSFPSPGTGAGVGASRGGVAGRAAGTSTVAPALTDAEALRLADEVASGGAGAAGRREDVTAGLGVSPALTEARLREVVVRLRQLLDTERRASRAARSDLLCEVASRTEGEMLLRQAIDEARGGIEEQRRRAMDAEREEGAVLLVRGPRGRRSVSPSKRAMASPASAEAVSALLSPSERSELLSQLLTHDTLLAGLHAIVFPLAGKGVSAVAVAPDAPGSQAPSTGAKGAGGAAAGGK